MILTAAALVAVDIGTALAAALTIRKVRANAAHDAALRHAAFTLDVRRRLARLAQLQAGHLTEADVAAAMADKTARHWPSAPPLASLGAAVNAVKEASR